MTTQQTVCTCVHCQEETVIGRLKAVHSVTTIIEGTCDKCVSIPRSTGSQMPEQSLEENVNDFGRLVRDFGVHLSTSKIGMKKKFGAGDLAEYARTLEPHSENPTFTNGIRLGKFLAWMTKERPVYMGASRTIPGKKLYKHKGFIRLVGFSSGRSTYMLYPSIMERIRIYMETGEDIIKEEGDSDGEE